MDLNRQRYRAIGVILTFIGGFFGVWFSILDVSSTSLALTLGPVQNQIYTSSPVPLYTGLVFLFAAVFSFGLSMLLGLHPPDKN